MNQSKRNKTRLIAVLPTSFTLGNAVCGFAAITYAMQMEVGSDNVQPLFMAGALIMIGMIFDALDGGVARLTRQTSDFGAELDSLCDAVTFGVAPAVLLVKMPHVLPERLLWCIALLYVLCAVMRLARFNADRQDGQSKNWFRGLPSPAAAGTIAAVAICWPGMISIATGDALPEFQPLGAALLLVVPIVVPWIALMIAFLMVSKVRYPHPMKQMLQGKRQFMHLVQGCFILVAVFAIHELALPLVLLVFAFASPARALLYQLTVGIARSKQETITLGD